MAGLANTRCARPAATRRKERVVAVVVAGTAPSAEPPTFACHVCGLSLVSSAHLARSYHHLFPVPLFQEESTDLLELSTTGDLRCRGCGKSLVIAGDNGAGNNGAGEKYEVVLKCPKCAGYFCIACDVFIHEDLHNCPGCEEALG